MPINYTGLTPRYRGCGCASCEYLGASGDNDVYFCNMDKCFYTFNGDWCDGWTRNLPSSSKVSKIINSRLISKCRITLLKERN